MQMNLTTEESCTNHCSRRVLLHHHQPPSRRLLRRRLHLLRSATFHSSTRGDHRPPSQHHQFPTPPSRTQQQRNPTRERRRSQLRSPSESWFLECSLPSLSSCTSTEPNTPSRPRSSSVGETRTRIPTRKIRGSRHHHPRAFSTLEPWSQRELQRANQTGRRIRN